MYIIIGGNGFLGSYIIKNIIENTSENVIATYREKKPCSENERIKWEKCDLSDISSINDFMQNINKISNKKIIYLAAYHHPDLVEENPQLAWHINITQLSYFINKLESVTCFFYPSSDSVYGESLNMYAFKEDDELKPENTYGKQKVVAERVVLGYGYNVIRFPFLIGPSLLNHKTHFYDKIKNDLSNHKKVNMLFDSYRSSLDFNNASKILIDLVEKYNVQMPKILNVSADCATSKYDIGVMIAEKYHYNKDLVVPISFKESGNFFKTKRAKSTLMDNSELKRVLNIDKVSIKI